MIMHRSTPNVQLFAIRETRPPLESGLIKWVILGH